MGNQKSDNIAGNVVDVTDRLPALAAVGTPAEIVDAFNRFCAQGDDPLSAHLFFQMVEQAPIALSITDAQATIVYANRMFEVVTGYRREEVIGKNESILSNQATPKSVYEALWAAVTDKQTWTGKLVNRSRSGDAYLAELTISPVLDQNGKVTHYLGMHRDVSKVHELQRRLTHQKGLLETILDTAPVVVALLDANRRVLLDNQEYKKLLGDLRGQEPAEVLLQAVADQAGAVLPQPGERGDDFRNLEVRLDFASGASRWFVCSATWLDDPALSASSYFEQQTRDITCLFIASETTRQRREHERARTEELRAGLAEHLRVGSMREALAAASFQIQQPLNLINAVTAMLSRSGSNEHLLPVLEQVAQSARCAYDTLQAALPAEGDEPLRHINLNEVVKEVLELSTDRLLKNGIVIDWKPTAALPHFTGQTKLIRGMIMNLVDNAIVALSESDCDDKAIVVETAQDGGVLVLRICDNGRGIDAADRAKVFEPLHCGWSDKTGHAGMGLPLAQETASRHGGSVSLQDDEGKGCCLVVELPLAQG
ncbi:MAG: nitrogen fixation negative regulator NifL [Gammaproteobacteria bacterium]|nr:nitrogen fixation negative regulator NifL [Gammaproteobacteria bacterium]